MKKYLKKIIKILISKTVSILFIFKFGRYILEKIQIFINLKTYKILYKKKEYNFLIPNRLNYFRAKTFFSKEPETIRWIENFDDNSIFWDVGANIGLYSCFAAKEKKTKSYAFEPSAFNIDLLTKNIFNNNVNDKVIVVPFSLTEKSKISYFNMMNTEPGGSRSSFSEIYNEDGKFDPFFKYQAIGLSGNDLVNKLSFDKPNYIKIDVDGIEYLILQGLNEILDGTKSILIEVSENNHKNKEEINKFLKENNFIFTEKSQSDLIKYSKFNSNTFNEIWTKK